MGSGMEENKSLEFILIEGIPDKDTFETLVSLYTTIFNDAQPHFFTRRISEKENVVAILATHHKKPIGFKIGYHYDENIFYSWVGGVTESYRKQGVAMHLAKLQEDWARAHGYRRLRTKSMNCFKPMMILNLKNDFDIKQVYTNDRGQTKIVFEKNILK